MRLIKPQWLTHPGEQKDFEVYSCHVSPDGSRLATAAGDGYVRVWSTEAILNSNDPTYTKPKQLAAVSHHSGTIHAVRFSSNGKYLASGADDKIVCVYALDKNAPTHAAFGSNEPPPVENWRVIRRLIGHDNDVQDLGWSFDSSILVSVGLDSKVVVWSGHSFEKLKTLSNHQSHVKGITFDPANKYFATASDDRTIKVYRFNSPPQNASQQDQVNNFVLDHTITVPFQTSPLTTYFRRCSWSPDGAHIAAANATNGPVSSVAILSRGTWDGDISLVGHEGPVEVTSFSPRLFYRDPPRPDKDGNITQQTVTIVACAGQDKCLSVWNTSLPRPFMIFQELAGKAISDLSWSPHGETLYATSLDGSIMTLMFQPGELGYPASLAENEKTLAKFGAGRRVGIIESTDALLLEESSKNGELKGVQGRMGALMGDGGAVQPPTITNGTNGIPTTTLTNGSSATAQPQAPAEPPPDQRVEKLKQRVTVTKDGKKRIAPMLMSSSSGVGESSLPQTQLLSATTTSGGRSDNPHNILDLSKPYDGFPKGGLATMLIGNKRKFAEIEGDEDKQVERRLAASVRPGGAAIVLNSENGLIPPAAAPPKNDLQEIPKVLRPAIVNPAMSLAQVRLAVPKVRSVIVRTMDGSEPPQNGVDANTGKAEIPDTVILEARNASGPSRTGRPQDHDPTRMTCTSKGQSLWQDFLPKAVLLVTGNTNLFAAACEDGSVYAWTPAGRRTLNAMVLEAQPVIMDCRGWWLMCITAVGMVYIWNLKTMSAPHPPISLAPILDIAAYAQGPHLTRSPGIVFARLNSAGRIIVAMSNGEGYAYNPDMYIWQRISEPWWGVTSQYWNSTDSSVGNIRSSQDKNAAPKEKDDMVSIENISAGIIPALERNTTNQSLLQGRAFHLQRLIKILVSAEGYETFESSASVAHLENRVAAARTLGAREEFKIYLTMYVKRLGAEGLKGKIEELLRSLASSLVAEDEDEGGAEGDGEEGEDAAAALKEPEVICGWKREELLREAVLILGKHRDLQRITVPYARLLGIVVDGQRQDEAMVTDM
ncbi:WD40 repeat [Pyrenophora tritici-repentis]|uniref:Protein HIR n=1 Tax=Pyrenophora tritici-repentis TaxID=45151 RepID=A0A2W1GEV1_9PLEO|nr:Histone transcription regulator HIRA WD repeat superfamily [Pyrenophora tritici-repentis]KAF7453512.1 Histone transcription regulator HIRA WD repeat superfamily [Pyrenophora tritici-repentis]KAF7576590.1 WD40 repeat protein [Pyrenophora tritici-repentis]KAG9387266.1 Histone transcription regulator HIRA WD repeat superfamily [Pyrenophora tritici-repentis]KAI0589495.1 Histone transcription regulator HIRA WD repeat superfamily [Pyrenophora tritici-repentis]